MTNYLNFEGLNCPLPLTHKDKIVLGHGSGGRMTQDLINKVFLSHFRYPPLLNGNDFAQVSLPFDQDMPGSLSISTDSHIVKPLFFPGGDIGKLAICGTVNDVSMSGAIPLYITAGFIIEEGLQVDILEQVVKSMSIAAEEAGVQIVSGDTKVVEKGDADQLFINTSGIGWIPPNRIIGGEYARPGDDVIISGTLGDHGIAVLSARGDLGLDTNVQSDVAPLNRMIKELVETCQHVHVLRDPTRGGLATSLNEIAMQSKVGIILDEDTLPIRQNVRKVCELLGFDPLYIANEGKVIVVISPEDTETALEILHRNIYGNMATRIGVVTETPIGRVLLHTTIGGTRIIDTLAGEILPRIC